MIKPRILNKSSVITSLLFLREQSHIDKNGSVKITAGAAERMAQELLVQSLSFGDTLGDSTKRGLVIRSIFRWLKYKNINGEKRLLSSFLRAVNVELQKLEINQRVFTVLMFLSLDKQHIDDFKEISILDVPLVFLQWDQFSELDVKDLWKNLSFHYPKTPIIHKFNNDILFPNTTNFLPISIAINTYGPEGAVDIASDTLDLFRACINLPSLYGQFTLFRSLPKPISPLPPSPVYGVFNKDGSLNNFYISVEDYDYKRIRIKKHHLNLSHTYIQKLNSVKQRESLLVFVRALKLYQDAIDLSSREHSYLAFWRVLEVIAAVNSNRVPQTKIESRINALIKPDKIIRDLFSVLVDRRNDLVHSGIFSEENDSLLFSLKLVVDMALSRLILLADEFPTPQHIEEFFNHGSVNTTDLTIKQEVIEHILRTRK